MNASRYVHLTRCLSSFGLSCTVRTLSLHVSPNAAAHVNCSRIPLTCVANSGIARYNVLQNSQTCNLLTNRLTVDRAVPNFALDLGHQAGPSASVVTRIVPKMQSPLSSTSIVSMDLSSTLKKRRLKMNKHKYRKRRKRDRRRSK